MTIEVRQMVIRSNVGGAEPAQLEPDEATDWREKLRAEVLAECKAWLEERLRRERER